MSDYLRTWPDGQEMEFTIRWNAAAGQFDIEPIEPNRLDRWADDGGPQPTPNV